jgi:diguanylate cyclase (GGDEF)-like protein
LQNGTIRGNLTLTIFHWHPHRFFSRRARALRMAAAALLTVALSAAVLAETAPRRLGYPLLTAFDQQQHHGGSQTFALAQDGRGILYFANLRGVLTYDGAWWGLITLPRNMPALAVDVDSAGRIGVGTVDDFGVLVPDSHGVLHYRSLLPSLPAGLTDLGEIDYVVADGPSLIFASSKVIIRWTGSRSTLLADNRDKQLPRRVFPAPGGKLLIGSREGLQELGGPTTFAGKRVDFLIHGLVAVRNEGLFTRDEKPLATTGSEWLKKKTVMDACMLADGRIAFTTLRDGILITDGAGNLEQVVGREAGMPESLLYGARPDHEGSLWVVHDLGMVRIDLSSPVTIIDARSGLKGSVHELGRHHGRVYACSSHGLFVIDNGTISQVDGIQGSPWSLVSLGDELLVGASSGVYVFKDFKGDGKPQRVAGTEQDIIYSMAAAPGDSSHLYLGLPDGLGSLRRDAAGNWKYEGLLPQGKPYVRSFVEHDGALWCGTSYDGVLRIGRDGSMRGFGENDVTPLVAGGRLLFTTSEHDGQFLQLKDGRLVPDPILGATHAPDRWEFAAADRAGNVWINTVPPSVVRRLNDGRYEREARSTVAMPVGDIETMRLDDADGTVWIGGDHGLFRVAPSAVHAVAPPPAPVIRRITSGSNGQILFGGFGKAAAVELPHAFQRLRIEVGPASFHPGVHYQFRLDPIDERWSAWRDEPLLEYTNLSEGKYTFRARARGASGDTGPETSWAFQVLPPWYRATWAVALWLLAAAALVALLVSLRTRTLRVQAERLRARVAEQTIALREANAQLEKLAVSDDLTGIPNRREFERALATEWERAIRSGQALGLILLDLDHFKNLNDTRGHQAGDQCLRRIGQVLADTIRGSGDVAARYGGEEFALLLPGTDAPGAAIVAERLRQIIERLRIENGPQQVITASFGIASLVPERQVDPNTLVARADRALYAAKRAGRNCVRLDDATSGGSWLESETA